MRHLILICFFSLFSWPCLAQFIEVEQDEEYVKIKHADPVFEDLTTDLGARRGENELNLNFGYRKLRQNHHAFLSQLEYEIAPINNLGIEVVVPYTVYFNNQLDERDRPENRMEFFQWATQYTFLKSEKRNISMALSFRNILETQDPNQTQQEHSLATITYNPFMIFAKNWQEKYFFLISGGIQILQETEQQQFETSYPINTAFHYRFSENGHFLGVEFNKMFEDGSFEMFVRPQIIVEPIDNFIIGASVGIPIGIPDVSWTAFLRLAYEFR